MGQDDDRDCVEHLWRLAGFVLADDGAHTDYTCERCPAVMVVPPGGVHPETA